MSRVDTGRMSGKRPGRETMQGRAAGNPMAAMGRERSGVPKGTDIAEEGSDSACRGNRAWRRRTGGEDGAEVCRTGADSPEK